MPQPECLRHLSSGGRQALRYFLWSESTERHQEPHVHVVGDFGKASISLIDLRLLAPPHLSRKFPAREVMKVLKDHQQLLLEEWEELRRKDHP
jgi:hypothetical protein